MNTVKQVKTPAKSKAESVSVSVFTEKRPTKKQVKAFQPSLEEQKVRLEQLRIEVFQALKTAKVTYERTNFVLLTNSTKDGNIFGYLACFHDKRYDIDVFQALENNGFGCKYIGKSKYSSHWSISEKKIKAIADEF